MLLPIKPIFSRSQVVRAGNILRVLDLENYSRALDVLSNWRAIHTYPINTFQATLRDRLKNIDKDALVAQRLKRSVSIISKLQRYPQMQLSRMQDIGGIRAIVKDIDAARKLRNLYIESQRFQHELGGQKDYITSPKPTGYRGIHLIYKYKNINIPDFDGLYIELQIRTKLQHAWATSVETMGTFLKQALKSSEGPDQWLDFFALTGSAFAMYEKCNPVPGYENLSELEIYAKVLAEAVRLNVTDRLMAYSIAADQIINQSTGGGSYHLVVLNTQDKTVTVTSYGRRKLEEANKAYSEYEKLINEGDGAIQVVLVATDSIDSLKQAYPNYFLDTNEFLKALTSIEEELAYAKKNPPLI